MSAREFAKTMSDQGRSIAYAKGAWARLNGAPESTCPYGEVLVKARAGWHDGWNEK